MHSNTIWSVIFQRLCGAIGYRVRLLAERLVVHTDPGTNFSSVNFLHITLKNEYQQHAISMQYQMCIDADDW